MLYLYYAIEDCGGEYMKPKISLFLSVIFIAFLISPLYADAIEPLARPPIIATAIGDGAASDVLALVCEMHGIDYENILQLKPEDFTERLDSENAPGTLIIAPGAMVEGDLYTVCGVEEIDVGQEISRIEDLISIAKKRGVPVVAIHIEGGFTSPDNDPRQSFDLLMPKADYIILVSPEGPSEYFSALSEETGVQLIVVYKAERIVDALELLFSMGGS
ncbi:MAG: transcriptional regulator, RpiR family protein [Thermotogaceae bacterium]|nr:transcriptional regulator, RpiR family protein [Thermotogaceae bacterium]